MLVKDIGSRMAVASIHADDCAHRLFIGRRACLLGEVVTDGSGPGLDDCAKPTTARPLNLSGPYLRGGFKKNCDESPNFCHLATRSPSLEAVGSKAQQRTTPSTKLDIIVTRVSRLVKTLQRNYFHITLPTRKAFLKP